MSSLKYARAKATPMRLALVAMMLVGATLAALPVAGAVASPYAGTWSAYATTTAKGSGPCASDDPIGQEQLRGKLAIRDDGTYSMATQAYSILLRIDDQGALTLNLTPVLDACSEASGTGHCATTSHCEGSVVAGDGGAFDFRLERTAPTPNVPPPRIVVTRDHVIVAPPDSTRMIRLSEDATLHVRAGPEGATINITSTVATDPTTLAEPKPDLGGQPVGRRYLQFESDVRAGSVRSVTLTVDLDALGLELASKSADVRFHYWTGARWAILHPSVALVEGQGEPDLLVLDRDVDVADGKATLKVNHLSSYAVTLQTQSLTADTQQETSQTPAPSAALLLAGLAAAALLHRRSRNGSR